MVDTKAEARASSIMFWSGLAGDAYSSWQSAEMSRFYGGYQNDVYKLNARLAQVQARDAIVRGREAARRYGEQASRVLGAQRASAAAQGLSLAEGTPSEIAAESHDAAMMDVLQITNNAYREAMGYKAQAMNLRLEGAGKKLAGEIEAQQTLTTRALGTIGALANRYTREREEPQTQAGAAAQTVPGSATSGPEIDYSSKSGFLRTRAQFLRATTTMSEAEIQARIRDEWTGMAASSARRMT